MQRSVKCFLFKLFASIKHLVTLWKKIFTIVNVLSLAKFAIFFPRYVFVHFQNFLLCYPSKRSTAAKCRPRWQPTRTRRLAVQLWAARFEPGTAGQQSGALALRHCLSSLNRKILKQGSNEVMIKLAISKIC
jgi:hypothetical protein